MTINTKFNELTVVDQGLVLQYEKKEKEIPFSEIENIFIKVNKLRPVCELGIILLLFFLVFLSVQYLAFEKVMFLGLSTVILVFIKIKNYKSYGLRICLKGGTIFRKNLSLNEKNDHVSIVNAVRRKMLNHY